MPEYILYKNKAKTERTFEKNEMIEIKMFRPHIWKPFMNSYNDKKTIRTFIFRFYISLLTFGKTEIYFAEDRSGNLIHSAYVIPRNFKYPFLTNNEWCIGPCNTPENFRGKGIYPYVLRYILKRNQDRDFCMFIREENISSQRGVVKAGFLLDDNKITGTKYLNRFCIKSKHEG